VLPATGGCSPSHIPLCNPWQDSVQRVWWLCITFEGDWVSSEAIRVYAGDDVGRAQTYPEDAD
jgi:hypothetical protein